MSFVCCTKDGICDFFCEYAGICRGLLAKNVLLATHIQNSGGGKVLWIFSKLPSSSFPLYETQERQYKSMHNTQQTLVKNTISASKYFRVDRSSSMLQYMTYAPQSQSIQRHTQIYAKPVGMTIELAHPVDMYSMQRWL